MIQQTRKTTDAPYKQAFVDFIKSKEWHWFITIPIGLCDREDEVLKRLKAIEAAFCGKYLVNRYHKLPDEARFSMAVAFEGEIKCGTRHAHILTYIPAPTKMKIPQSMLSSLFPFEFRFLWNKFKRLSASKVEDALSYDHWTDISFGSANTARAIYTVKNVRKDLVSWSRFEFVTPPKFGKFDNENLSVIRNRHRQKEAVRK